MLLESREHPVNCFVTLTYEDECVVWDSNKEFQVLVKKDLQEFIRQLRKWLPGRTIRYFGAGEYGEQSLRPHYHVVLFGVGVMDQLIIRMSWLYGFCHVGSATPESMSYTASYIMKGLTDPKMEELKGRPPEFRIMSLKPGIGHGVVQRILATNVKDKLVRTVRVDGKIYPLGRYLSRKVDDALGITANDRWEGVCAAVEPIIDEVKEKGRAAYWASRQARILAGHGRINSKRKAKSV